MQIAYLDGPRLRRSLMAACDFARTRRGELNRINVFPVPDGDTGTNLALTVRAVGDHLRANRDRDVAGVAREAAEAAVLGARGNCGMLLSHFLLGFADELQGRERIGVGPFGEAMVAGADSLSAALERPVEGTILTVIRDTATAALAPPSADFALLLHHLLARARESLARTPDLLPVLRKAGVVDAGAKGFVHLLEGVVRYLEGEGTAPPEDEPPAGPGAPALAAVGPGDAESPFRFCTEALVRGDALPSRGGVTERLRHAGDSLIVIRSNDLLKVHVHTDEPERVFAYLRQVGRLVTHKAEDMRAQRRTLERAADGGHVRLARRPVGIVTDSACDLSEEVIRAHGIHVVPCLLVTPEREYRDGIDITAEDFHRRMATDEVLPTTSQPAPAAFLEAFRTAASDAETVVGVILGSALSGTFASAEAAAGRAGGPPIRLVDSRAVSLLEGLLVLRAAELGELGRSPEDIAAELAALRDRSGLLFTVDTFDRLLASGRVGRGAAWLGTMLSVKPILELGRDGTVGPVGKVFGRAGVTTRILELLDERLTGASRVRFGIVHVGRPEIVETVGAALRERFPAVEVLSAPATPVISTHIGLGAWGVAWMVEA